MLKEQLATAIRYFRRYPWFFIIGGAGTVAAVLVLFIAFVEGINTWLYLQEQPPFFIEHIRLLRALGFICVGQAAFVIYVVGNKRRWPGAAALLALLLLLSPLWITAPAVRAAVRAAVPADVRERYNLAPQVTEAEYGAYADESHAMARWARENLPDEGTKVFVFDDINNDFRFKILSHRETNMTNKEGSIWMTAGFADSKRWYQERQRYNEVMATAESFDFAHLFDLAAYRRLRAFVRRERIEIVYATLDKAIVAARLLKFLQPSLQVIIRESGMADRKAGRMKALDIVSNAGVRQIIAVSEEVRQSLLRYQPWYRRKMAVVPNGVAVAESRAEVEARLRQRHAAQEPFTILHVGSLRADGNKGQPAILEAAAAGLRDYAGEWRLVFAGRGELAERLRERARELGVAERLVLPGYVPPAEVGECYRQADTFVLNSGNEGCPNVVLEAMSYGLPVIASRVGGVLAMVAEGVSGHIVATDDRAAIAAHLRRLAEQPAARLAMGLAGYDRITEHFTFEEHMQRLMALLQLRV